MIDLYGLGSTATACTQVRGLTNPLTFSLRNLRPTLLKPDPARNRGQEQSRRARSIMQYSPHDICPQSAIGQERTPILIFSISAIKSL